MPDKLKPILTTDKTYIFLYGGRGGAKSVSVSKTLLHLGNISKKRVLCTREIQNSIKDSVHTLLKDIISELKYENYIPLDNIIKHSNGTEFIFTGLLRQDIKQSIKSYANIDFCWVEEAQAVSKGSLDVLIPTIRKPGSQIIFTFNRLFPDDPVWKFMESLPEDQKLVIQINWDEIGNLLPETLRMLAELSKAQYESGQNEDYLHIWKGEPVGFSERTVLTLRSIQDAMDREINEDGQEVVGVDVARFGADKTVFIKRKGLKMRDMKQYSKLSVVEVASRIVEFVNNDTKIKILLDATGVGGGVADILRKDGFNVIDINFGGKPKNSDKYNNVISEMWFEFKDQIDQIQLINNSELKSQLCTREWKMDNKERRCIESKDDYKKRGFKSPDLADACLLCYYNPASSGMSLVVDFFN